MSCIVQHQAEQSNSSSYYPIKNISNQFELISPVKKNYSSKLTESDLRNLVYKHSVRLKHGSKAKAVLLAISDLCDRSTGVMLRSHSEISKIAKCCVRTVCSVYELLKKDGSITSIQRGYKKTNHTVLLVVQRELRDRNAKCACDLNPHKILDRDLKDIASYDEYFNLQKDKERHKKRYSKKNYNYYNRQYSVEERGSPSVIDLSGIRRFTEEEEQRITPVSMAQIAQMRAVLGVCNG